MMAAIARGEESRCTFHDHDCRTQPRCGERGEHSKTAAPGFIACDQLLTSVAPAGPRTGGYGGGDGWRTAESLIMVPVVNAARGSAATTTAMHDAAVVFAHGVDWSYRWRALAILAAPPRRGMAALPHFGALEPPPRTPPRQKEQMAVSGRGADGRMVNEMATGRRLDGCAGFGGHRRSTNGTGAPAGTRRRAFSPGLGFFGRGRQPRAHDGARWRGGCGAGRGGNSVAGEMAPGDAPRRCDWSCMLICGAIGHV